MRDRQGRHTFTRRITIKRPNTTSCTWFASPSLASLDSRLGCSSEYTLGHGHQLTEGLAVFIDTTDFMGGIYIDDRPVPGFVFNYDLNTNIKANPIPSLCVDISLSLLIRSFQRVTVPMLKVRNFLCSCQRILLLPLVIYISWVT